MAALSISSGVKRMRSELEVSLSIGTLYTGLVVLLYVAVGLFKQIFVLVQFVFEEGFAKRLFHKSLASIGVLPFGEPNLAHDIVDVRDHALDDDRRLVGLHLKNKYF